MKVGTFTIELYYATADKGIYGFGITYLRVARLLSIQFINVNISIYSGDRVKIMRENLVNLWSQNNGR